MRIILLASLLSLAACQGGGSGSTSQSRGSRLTKAQSKDASPGEDSESGSKNNKKSKGKTTASGKVLDKDQTAGSDSLPGQDQEDGAASGTKGSAAKTPLAGSGKEDQAAPEPEPAKEPPIPTSTLVWDGATSQGSKTLQLIPIE